MLLKADWLGIAFMAVGLASLTIFLEEGNSARTGSSPSFIITFAALALIRHPGLGRDRLRRAPSPSSTCACTASVTSGAATMLSAVIGMGLYGSSFLLPLFLGQIAGYSPMQIGEVIAWAGLPQLFVMPFVAAVAKSTTASCACSACCCSAFPA
jgi:DHA2 family multidrug resistance protein